MYETNYVDGKRSGARLPIGATGGPSMRLNVSCDEVPLHVTVGYDGLQVQL